MIQMNLQRIPQVMGYLCRGQALQSPGAWGLHLPRHSEAVGAPLLPLYPVPWSSSPSSIVFSFFTAARNLSHSVSLCIKESIYICYSTICFQKTVMKSI